MRLEDPELRYLKELMRYGESNDYFMIKAPPSDLYRMIVKKSKIVKRNNLLCIVDNKSIRINTLYKNEVHRNEIAKWSDRLGKISFEFEATEADLKNLKMDREADANWRLNKKPGNITRPGLSFTETIQPIGGRPLVITETMYNLMDSFILNGRR